MSSFSRIAIDNVGYDVEDSIARNVVQNILNGNVQQTTSTSSWNTAKIVWYTGTTSGTAVQNHCFYYDGSNWVDCGEYNLDALKLYTGSSSTLAGTATKVVDCSDFVLRDETLIWVDFSQGNTVTNNMMLNVNSTGAIPVYYYVGHNQGVRTSIPLNAPQHVLFQYTASDGRWWVVATSPYIAPTPDKVVITDSYGRPSPSSVTTTELNYLSGANSNIQTQITDLNNDLKYFIDLPALPGDYKTDQEVLFTSADVPVRSKIYYKFTTTTAAAWMAFYDANNTWLASIGKTASASGDTSYEGNYTIPNNFATCKIRVASSGVLSLEYLMSDDSLPKAIANLENKLDTTAITDKGLSSNATTYSDLNSMPANSFVTLYGSASSGILNKPNGFNDSVFSVLTLHGASNGGLQLVWESANKATIYFRRYVSGSWRLWQSVPNREIVITVRTDGSGDYTSVVDAVMYTMTHSTTPSNPYVIDIGEGTFDLSAVATKVINGQLDERGLFIAPNTTIRGKGTEKTKLTFNYTPSATPTEAEDAVMSQVSVFNVVYESALQDLSIECKNIRYVFHADYGVSTEAQDETNEKIKNNTFVMENVIATHNGFDAGLNPTYKAPAVWGQGLRTNLIRKFTNCRFISKESYGWFCHDRIGTTKGCQIFFDGCEFVSLNFNPALRFISWGSDCRHVVNLKNCMINSYLSLAVNTTYNANAKIDYYVEAEDCDCLVIEDTTNDSHKSRNFNNFGTQLCVNDSGATISKFTPVKIKSYNKAYVSGSGLTGIAMNEADAGGLLNVKTSGRINIVTSFSVGTIIGHDGSSWVADSDGFLMVLNSNCCVFI